MGRRNKLAKFADLLTLPNVYENFEYEDQTLVLHEDTQVLMSGRWQSKHFKNDNRLVLELACGRGEYSVALGRMFPRQNFIGVDIKGARIWKGAKIAHEEGLSNVCFLRTRIEKIEKFFTPSEIDEIWITFPDPFLRESKENRRLTSPMFLDQYRNVLKKGGLVQLKTDSEELYTYTKEVLAADPQCTILYDNPDIYSKPLDYDVLEVKTYYEKMHLANQKKITYLRFTIS